MFADYVRMVLTLDCCQDPAEMGALFKWHESGGLPD